MTCYSCDANSGVKRISAGRTIFEGKYWNVEHAYPSALLGWTVIVLKRHCEELHNLYRKEWAELGQIQYFLMRSLKNTLELEKEYVACFAEKEGFKHIHFHVIPKTIDFDPDSVGTKAFSYINPKDEATIPGEKVAAFCDRMHEVFHDLQKGDK